jgi:soluble lytic murein transglycosylase-like protein
VPIAVALAVTVTSVGTDAATHGAAIPSRAAVSQAIDASPYAPFVAEAAQRFGLPIAWIRAVIRTESHGDQYAVSPAGAMGLMQIMPETWRFERARLKLGNDPFDARDNILAGADYLSTMRHRYGEIGMLAAYNAGPGRYEDFRKRDRPLPTETVAYVRRLAPVVSGGVAAYGPAITPSDPPAWTSAPLFATRSISVEAGYRATAYVSPIAKSAGSEIARQSTEPTINSSSRIIVDPPADGMFVALAGPQS